MIKKKVNFDEVEISKKFDDFSNKKFAIIRCCLLSTAPNSHELEIGEEVLRRDSKTILGNFVVAKMQNGDATGHMSDEVIMGYFPMEQEIEFEEVANVVKAYAYAVISKQYAKDFYEMFTKDNHRKASIEMTVQMQEDDEHKVYGFDAFGLTCLGRLIAPSCEDAEMSIIRFSNEEAEKFFEEIHKGTESKLNQFAQSRREQFMAETKKTYKVDKSKEAMSTKAWGEVDKAELRDKIMDASNRTSLVKDVYMLVEDGWEDSPSEHLKYPVMNFDGDVLVYNRDGLASALGYAKKENETAVVTKVEKIYKKLGLEEERKEEDKNMSKEIEFAAVEIGDLWGKVFNMLHSKYPDGEWGSVYRIEGIYEEDNKKFAVIRKKDEEAKYRLDFSLTEDGLTLADEIVKVELEIVETDEIRKFSEPEESDKYKKFGDEDEKDEEDEKKMSCEDMETKMAEMQSDIESRDNIIMEKEKELEELRKFKADIENKEKAMSVDAIMAEVKECFEEVKFSELRDEGLACSKETLDAWANKVKAYAFSAVKKSPTKKNPNDIWELSAPVQTQKTNKGLWD